MKHFIAYILFSFIVLVSFAQKGKVVGKVTNSRNEGLSGVTIKIAGGATGFTKTDLDGRFVLPIEAGKKYSITLSYVGYREKIVDEISLTKVGEEETLNVMLDEAGKALEAVLSLIHI